MSNRRSLPAFPLVMVLLLAAATHASSYTANAIVTDAAGAPVTNINVTVFNAIGQFTAAMTNSSGMAAFNLPNDTNSFYAHNSSLGYYSISSTNNAIGDANPNPTITLSGFDDSAATIMFSSPVNNSAVTAVPPLSISFTKSGSQPSSINLSTINVTVSNGTVTSYYSNGAGLSCTGTTAVTCTNTASYALGVGSQTITATATDYAENPAASSIRFTVGAVPTVLVYGLVNGSVAHTAGGTYQASFPVNISTADAAGFTATSCSVFVGGVSTTAIGLSNGWCNGTIAVPSGLADGNNIVNVSIADSTGNLGSNTSFDVYIDNEGYGASSSLVNITTSTGVVAISAGTPNTTIIVPSNAVSAELNISTVLVNAGTSNANARINVSVTANTTSSLLNGTVNVMFPANVTVSGPADWDGTIDLPIVYATSAVTVPPDSGYTSTTYAVVNLGYGNEQLRFNHAVRILIPGMAGYKAAYQTGSTVTRITNTCPTDDQFGGDSVTDDCEIDVGSDMVIWTRHFTAFAAYKESATTSANTNTYTITNNTITPVPGPVLPTVQSPAAIPVASPIINETPITNLTDNSIGEASATASPQYNGTSTTSGNGASPTPQAGSPGPNSSGGFTGTDLIIAGLVIAIVAISAFIYMQRKPPLPPVPTVEPPAKPPAA